MNMVEPSSSLNAHVTNAKINLSVRPIVPDDAETAQATQIDGSPTPTQDSPPNVIASGEVTDAAMAPVLAEFKSIEDISVDVSTGELLVKVPSEQVGRMIGKNGLVIKELQSHSGAFINMAKEGELFRIARISGNYPETHICALMLVARYTPRDDIPKHEKLDALILAFRKLRPMFVVENFNVPAEHVGRIIGRGGHTIRELQDASHAKIDIPKAYPGVDSHRVLTISGSPDEVATCRELLKARIASMDARDHSFADGRYLNGVYPQSSFPYYAQVPYGMEHMAYGFSPYGFVPYAPVPYHAAAELSADISRVSLSPSVDSQDGDHHDHLVPIMHAPALHAPAALQAAAPIFVPSMQCESIVPVPADLGVAVKQLQTETKTRVDVLDPLPGHDPTMRLVRITALRPEHLRACEAHIKARIASHYGNGFA